MALVRIRGSRAEDLESLVPLPGQLWPGKPTDFYGAAIAVDRESSEDDRAESSSLE